MINDKRRSAKKVIKLPAAFTIDQQDRHQNEERFNAEDDIEG